MTIVSKTKDQEKWTFISLPRAASNPTSSTGSMITTVDED